jgi:thioredoxin-like negative regulator of GroEL
VGEEEALRQAIKANPNDAPSAVALGQVLFQAGKLDEAEYWLCYAVGHGEQLPDGGKLAERQLHYVALKKAGRKHKLSSSYAPSCR